VVAALEPWSLGVDGIGTKIEVDAFLRVGRAAVSRLSVGCIRKGIIHPGVVARGLASV